MNLSVSLPLRPSIGPPLQVSKWQQCPVLLDVDEMQQLMKELGDFQIVRTSGLIPQGEEIVGQEAFLEVYEIYVTALKQGRLPQDPRFRFYFSTIWTNRLEATYRVNVKPGYGVVKLELPVVQLQSHRFTYSFEDKKFRSMVFGYDSIEWGIQFSFPSLFQDADFNVFKVNDGARFSNLSLFRRLRHWIRMHTIATPFEVDEQRVNVPIRLGKRCLDWIHLHPQFDSKKLRVRV